MKKIGYFFADIFIYIFAHCVGFCLALMNDSLFFLSVRILARIFRILDKRRARDLMTNLDFAFESALDSREKARILKRCYENFAFVILNALRLLYMRESRYIAKFRVHNEALIEAAIKRGNFIFITAHYGDWEGTARFVAWKHKEIALSVVGRFTQFRSINHLMQKSRQKFGSFFLDKKGVSRQLARLLKDKKNVIGLVVDQNMTPSEGVWVKMFGKNVTHTPIAAILARKYKLPIIFAYMRLSRDYSAYDLYFEKVCDCIISEDSKRDILEMTQAQCDFTEKIIRESPHEWFWFHKRFKAGYKEIYTKIR